MNFLAASRLLSVVTVSLVLAACVSLKVGSDFDRSINFSGYRAFSWMPREHHGTRNPLVAQRARDAIQAELTRRGFNCRSTFLMPTLTRRSGTGGLRKSCLSRISTDRRPQFERQ